MPARREEVHHAKEEGIQFNFLTNPVAFLDDGKGNVCGMRCVRMAMGEKDEKGRRKFTVIEGSEFDMEIDTVVVALGTSPNPLIKTTTPGLDTETWGGLKADANGQTSRRGVFAGGDAVTGAATVILAMGAGRVAAKAIDEYLAAEK
jgi:glutamate synthase (NADPH/NADH) small chain